MYRFLAVLWNERNPQSVESVAALRAQTLLQPLGWRTALSGAGALVLHAGGRPGGVQPYRLPRNQGVVLGRLFRGRGDEHFHSVAEELDSHEAQRILDSKGRDLTERYWGRYVAFLLSGDGQRFILRDPTGGIPCYFTHFHGITLFFTHIEDCLKLSPQKLSINWTHLAGYLHFNRVVSRETGYREINQVLAGECITIRNGNASNTFYWNPGLLCRSAPIEDPLRAEKVLLDAVTNSIHASAKCYQRILLELSGLDSTIVLACLRSVSPQVDVTCLNLYTDAPGGDERLFARIAAEHFGCPLVETPFRTMGKPLSQMLIAENSLSPTTAKLASPAGDTRDELMRQRSIEAVFAGRGGDQLFQRRVGSFISTDYVHRHGLKPQLLRVAFETARLTGNAVLPILMSAVTYRFFKRVPDPYAFLEAPAFVHPESEQLVDYSQLRHPWVNDAIGLPESKVQQIFDLVDSQNYFSTEACADVDFEPPMISQRIIETVLRIPSFVLTSGGCDRALLRRAFASQLPRKLIHRRSKGEAVSFHQDLVRENRTFLREFLLDGLLVERRLLDKASLDTALSDKHQLVAGPVKPILVSALGEAWLRKATELQRSA